MFYIGIDIGTGSTRAALFDGAGRLLSLSSQAYPIHHPAPGYAEQDARAWRNATAKAIRAVLPDNPDGVVALSLSTQGGSTLPIDEHGDPLGFAISWMDARAAQQAASLSSAIPSDKWLAETGVVPSPHYSLCHIAWLRECDPERFHRAARFVTTLDYINTWLTGNCVIDPTNAVMTGMLGQNNAQWYEPALALLGLRANQLAEIRPTGALVGTLTKAAASELGLSPAVRVYNGAHDQCACALGSGVLRAGDSMLSCGTAWVLLAAVQKRLCSAPACLTPSFHADSKLRSAFYALSAGSQTLNWVCAQTGLSLEEINKIAGTRIEKNDAVLCYPYFAGATGLDAPAPAHGLFTGLDFATDKYDLALAAMEGTAFEISRSIAVFSACGIPIRQIRMLGGAAKSEVWPRIIAATTGMPVVRPAAREAALLGAAAMAMVGSGLFADYAAAYASFAGEETITAPEPDLCDFYSRKFARYVSLQPQALQFAQKR